ncbi:unnamed protein product [marine sediment metagenome]|uniref:Uncharacterized protein n=1 Tax=marine sediment metagenome TaxID=412755 RepID=X1AH77_9ZZZZ
MSITSEQREILDLTTTQEGIPFYCDRGLPPSLVGELASKVYKVTSYKRWSVSTAKFRVLDHHTEEDVDTNVYTIDNKRENCITKIYEFEHGKGTFEDVLGYRLVHKDMKDDSESFFCNVFCNGGHPMIECNEFSFGNTDGSTEWEETDLHPVDDISRRIVEFGIFQRH